MVEEGKILPPWRRRGFRKLDDPSCHQSKQEMLAKGILWGKREKKDDEKYAQHGSRKDTLGPRTWVK